MKTRLVLTSYVRALTIPPVDVIRSLHGITFIWDARKANANITKHGVAFADACEVFADPLLQSQPSQVRDGEVRETVIGLTSTWQLLFVAYVTGEEALRVISARPASPQERRFYENC